mgnify:CR=1 FL=1
MKTVILGLTVALLWGSADTLATFATKRIGSAATTRVAQVAGLLLVALVALAASASLGLLSLSTHALVLSILYGVVLGGVAAAAYFTLYKSLSHGPLAVVSPVVSAQGGVTLLLAVSLLQERLGGFPLFFLLATFAGVLFASTNVKVLGQLGPRSLIGAGGAYSLAALVCFGVISFGIGIASRETTWLLSVFWIRLFSCIFLAVFLPPLESAAQGNARAGWGYLLAGVVGCADAGGLLLLSVAMASGSIGVAGMLSSAYGIIPLAVGVSFLKERLTTPQLLGCLLLGTGLVGEAAPGTAVALPLAGLAVILFAGVVVILLYPLTQRLGRTILGALKHKEWLALEQALHTRVSPTEYQHVMRLMREFIMGFGTLDGLPPSVAIWGSARLNWTHPAYVAAAETARLLAQAGFGILTGGGPGIMEAGNKGARDGGGISIGCPMTSLTDEAPNPFQDVSVRFHSFCARKTMFVTYAEAMVIFPGGFGTLDELFEIVSLVQTKMVRPIPIILYDSTFWGGLLDWIHCMLAETAKTIHPEERDLLIVSDDPHEIARIVLDAHQTQTGTPALALSG